jgi:hypothetical protein
VLAALEQESFWLVHSSTENPGPEIAIQASNWWPQEAAAADARSSKSSSSTEKEEPDWETEGQRPPREELNSKNVSITVTTFLDAPLEEDLPFPDDEEEEEVETDAEELVVLVVLALDSETTAFPPPFCPDLLVVVSAKEAAEVEATSAIEVVVEEPFPPLPDFPVALAVEFENGAIVDETSDDPFDLTLATLEELVALDATLLSATSGPAATALAARAAAACPPEPAFEAALIVVPEPMTVNFVQSSGVPR